MLALCFQWMQVLGWYTGTRYLNSYDNLYHLLTWSFESPQNKTLNSFCSSLFLFKNFSSVGIVCIIVTFAANVQWISLYQYSSSFMKYRIVLNPLDIVVICYFSFACINSWNSCLTVSIFISIEMGVFAHCRMSCDFADQLSVLTLWVFASVLCMYPALTALLLNELWQEVKSWHESDYFCCILFWNAKLIHKLIEVIALVIAHLLYQSLILSLSLISIDSIPLFYLHLSPRYSDSLSRLIPLIITYPNW